MKGIYEVSGRRWNDIINVVNGLWEKKDIEPLSEVEEELFESVMADKKKLEEEYGHEIIFDNVEYDYDDLGLDIYNSSVEEMVEERNKNK